jgi:hypothetical protein
LLNKGFCDGVVGLENIVEIITIVFKRRDLFVGVNNMTCIKLREFLEKEKPHLAVEMKRHAWFLGEKKGHEVPAGEVQSDYLSKHAPSYLAGFRDCYCSFVCSEANSCDESRRIIDEANGA